MGIRLSPEGPPALIAPAGPRPSPQTQDDSLLSPDMLALMNQLGLGISGMTLELDPLTGQMVPKFTFKSADAAGAGASAALAGRQFGLSKLTSALSGYLQGTSAVAGRRLDAFQQAAALLPGMVDPSQKFFSGFEPQGALATAAGRAGLPFSPVEIQHQQLAPGELATTPELDPQVAALIQQIQGA